MVVGGEFGASFVYGLDVAASNTADITSSVRLLLPARLLRQEKFYAIVRLNNNNKTTTTTTTTTTAAERRQS